MASDDASLDPDELLKAIKDQFSSSGKLRIFLGMSAGVGKTYTMLEAAQQKKKEGFDVVVGLIETHGREETAFLTKGLEIVPRIKINYRGTILEEMDIDGILRRKPNLVLVDELAHTNVPGSRHQKRYQDVLELLDAGIDVYTTINVQHLESRKEVVESITGIRIRETVPDSILDRAFQLEMVDIVPSELLKRLKEGKVYLGEKKVTAADAFFKEDKLTALREIALRLTAEKVDQDLQKFTVTRKEIPWQANERLLVAVSHSPYSEKIIRATRRLAYNLEAPWIALHVNTGKTLNEKEETQLTKNLNLARELNAEVINTTETDLVAAIKRICRLKNVTQVIVGRPTQGWFKDILVGGPLLERLVRESLEVDVHVIRQEKINEKTSVFLRNIFVPQIKAGPSKYWKTLWYFLLLTGVNVLLEPLIGYRAVGFIFLLGVLILGLFESFGIVFFGALLSTLAWEAAFIPPKFTFIITHAEDLILCLSYFVVALITGLLTRRIRLQEKLMREREEKTNLLYQISQDISGSQEKRQFIKKINERVGNLLDGECRVILKTKDGDLTFEKINETPLDEKERAVALWSFQKQKPAGWSTDTLGDSRYLHIPLRGVSESVGIFLFKPKKVKRKLTIEEEELLYAITGQLGVSIERHFLRRRLAEAKRHEDSEALYQTLLSSISHEIRTPLTAITGSISSLESKVKNNPDLQILVEDLGHAGDRMNRVIENLLDMSRISSGQLSLKLEWQDPNDLMGVVLKKISKEIANRMVKIDIPENIGLLYIDFRLFEHAISNLMINALEYSGPEGIVQVQFRKTRDKYDIIVSDNGPGISESFIPQIFEKFYRVPGSQTGGTGLGLSIVKGIIELHRGKVYYQKNEPKGSKFIIEIPNQSEPKIPKEED